MPTAYGDITPRTAAYAEKELLKRGLPYLVLEKFGQAKPMPSNSTKVMKFRRYNSLPNTPVALTEGVTPAGQPLTVTDVTATLTQYGDKVTITDVILDTHEDPTLNEAIEVLGEQAAQMIEKMRFGVLKAGTNVLYANGANRAAVNTALSITVQRRAVRALKRQNGRAITQIVRSTPAYETANVAPGYVGLVHPDLESDVRALPGFVPAERYGSITPWENEIGKVDDVRYVSSTIFEPWANAGGAAGAMLSTGGVNADVYPPAIAGTQVKLLISTYPVDVPAPSGDGRLASTVTGVISVEDKWQTVLTSYVMGYAYERDVEGAGNLEMSQSYIQRALTLLGVQLQVDKAVGPRE